MANGVKFVVVPRKVSGECSGLDSRGPSPMVSIGNYHHVLAVRDDGSYSLLAAIYGAFSESEMGRLAGRLAGDVSPDLPVEVDPDFYEKHLPKPAGG